MAGVSTAMAQVGTLFNGEQHLSSSFVQNVFQDKAGFIWVATDNGLNRYDGYSFLTFGQEDGLSCDYANCVTADKNDNTIVGTAAGIFIKIKGRFSMLKEEGTDKEINFHITSFYHSPEGQIFFTTSGFGLWKITSETTARRVPLQSDNATFIKCIQFDRNGLLWVATEKKGLIAFKNTGSASAPSYKEVGTVCPEKNFVYPSMCKDGMGNIYVGFFEGGIYKLDNVSRTLIPITGGESLPVYSMALRRDGDLFIGTNGNGIKVLETKTNTIRNATLSALHFDLERTKVVSILEDNSHNMWLGLFQKGLFLDNVKSRSFISLGSKEGMNSSIGQSCVMAIMRQKSNGCLWVAADQDGLYKLDKDNKLIKHFSNDGTSNTVPATVLALTEDSKGRLWVGSYTDGCGWIDTETGQYHRSSFSTGASMSVFDLRTDNKGRIWIGTLGDGVKCYDPETEKLIEYRSKEGDKSCLMNNYVLQMELSPDGKMLFVGTATGMSILDIESSSWTKLLKGENGILPNNNINAIKYSPTSGLWVGTFKALYNIDLKTLKQTEYTTSNGLPNNHISSIEIEKSGLVWVSTNNGLCRLNPKTGAINCFYSSDGTQGNEYSEGTSFFEEDKNIMYFGGTAGMSYFNPDAIKIEDTQSNVTITSLIVGGERVKSFMKSGNYVVCEEAVSVADRFDFSHFDNNITINFSTLTYSGLEHIAFTYRINGDEWITLPQGENSLTLSRLSPGDYDFEIVANNNGMKSNPKKFTIVIHNAWYFTPFARIIYLLIIIGLVYWYLRNLKRSNQQKLRLQEHIHAEQLNEQKLQFFINASHEIRTPMTLIITPLMQLIREDKDTHRQSVYQVIRRNAGRILRHVNQLLDIRKLDKGLMQMLMRETDIVPFVEDALSLFSSQAENRKITVTFNHPKEGILVWIDRSQFDKVLVNLLSNAFKYVNTGGNIIINATVEDNKFKLSVFDDGEKISEHGLQHIFDRFYQSDSVINQNKAGTGVGLHLTRSIVELHHGTITAQNTDNGVEFIVTLPLGDAHLKSEEKANFDSVEEKDELISELKEVENILEEPKQEEPVEEEPVEEAASKEPVSKRPLVIIAEDDDDIREFLESQLRMTYRVMGFVDGKEALPAILREIPAVVLSDVMMPNMDGYTLCSRIKTNVNTNHVPVILLTAKNLDEDRLEGLECGADLFVTKPFNMEVLRRNITNLIASRKVMQNKYTGKEDLSNHLDEIEVESFDEKLLQRIMAVINSNLNNSDLNIDMICNEVGISRVHLHRKMKELTNQTPHDFIRNLRMKQAARMLSHKGQSVTEVMYRCGFSSATSFSTMFKKMYGVSPREYMREHAEK